MRGMKQSAIATGIIGLTVVLCLVLWPWAVHAELVDRIVAIVNNDVILLSELQQEMKPYVEQVKKRGYTPEQEKKMLFKLREDLLNRMIDKKLTDQEVKRYGISVDDDELNATIERIKSANLMTDEDLRKALKAQGMTYDEYRKHIREQILRERLMSMEVKSKIVVTRQDVQHYYDTHLKEYTSERKVLLHHITYPLGADADATAWQVARQQMSAIMAKLKAGTPFVKLESVQPPLRAGNLGEFRMEILAPVIRAAVSTLSAGQHTPLLKTDQGLQIFYVEKISGGKKKPLSDVAAAIRQKLYEKMVNDKFTAWLDKLRNQSNIKVIL